MEIENALATEMSRLVLVAGAASREIVARRPWWVAAIAYFRTVVL